MKYLPKELGAVACDLVLVLNSIIDLQRALSSLKVTEDLVLAEDLLYTVKRSESTMKKLTRQWLRLQKNAKVLNRVRTTKRG